MSVKIIFKNGTAQPVSSAWASSNGEPLWDRSHQKFYITNGTNTPTLIGPITISPEDDKNDNITSYKTENEVPVDMGEWDVMNGLVNAIGAPTQGYTQYVVDIAPTDYQHYRFIDLRGLFETVGKDRKITMFISGRDPQDEFDWVNRDFPLFWFLEDGCPAKVGIYYTFSAWVNGVKVFDASTATGGSDYALKDMMSTPVVKSQFALAVKAIMDYSIGTGKCKVELIPTIEENSFHVDIYVSCPSNAAVTVTQVQGSQNATLIATVNGREIWAPYCQGYVSVTGSQGIVVSPAGQGQQTVRPNLPSYISNVQIGSPSQDSSFANVSAIRLSQYNEYLCVHESSAFGDGASASYSKANSSIEWSLSGSARSYTTVVISDSPDSQSSEIELSLTSLSNTCQSDHYLYIFNNTNSAVMICPPEADNLGNEWSSYPVVGFPQPIMLKPNTGTEVSMALRRFSNQDINTAVMTMSEPLTGRTVVLNS